MIVVTSTFKKLLSKIRSVTLDDVKKEIQKHSSGIDNFVVIWNLRNRKVLKWYLLSKKVRLVVLFQEKNGNYLPFFIVKKETKEWYNISKHSLQDLESKLDGIFDDLDNWNYETF